MRWVSLPARGSLPGRRRELAAAVVAVVVVLYAWPLLAPPASAAASRVDLALRLVAVLAVALACLWASWRYEGRTRTALLVLVVGAQTWAGVQAVRLVRDLLGDGPSPPALDAAGVLVLTGCAAAAVWLLRTPGSRLDRVRVAVEWALLAASALVLMRLALPLLWASGSAWVDWGRATGAGALLAGAVVLWVRPRDTEHAWPWLPGALGLLAAALALATSSSDRSAGLLLTAGLALVALVVALGGAPRDEAPVDGPGRAALWGGLGGLPAAAGVALVVDAGVRGRVGLLSLGGAVVVGSLAALHGHLLGLQAREQVRELADAEQGLRHRAFHDDLTGLANRALLIDRLTRALDLHRRHGLPVTVLYGDLDGFKHVNDRHGHAVGDAVLAAVAERLGQCLRPEDTLARLGGDEFVLLLEHASSAGVVADRLHAVLLAPITVDHLHFELRMSIGSTRVEAGDPTPSPQEVLDRADADMYRRKAAGGGRTTPTPRTAPDLPDLAGELATAIAAGALTVVHQPLVDARTGEVHGTEALVRWCRDGQLLLPAAFVELADQHGLSGALTDLVLDRACAELHRWSDAVGHTRLTVAVNVPPSQLRDPTLVARALAAARRHGLRPEQLVLETSVAAVAALTEVDLTRADGPRLSLTGFTGSADDFALLTALPVQALKLPGAGLSDGDRLPHVLAALAPELGLRVVVERVQHPAELEAARELGGALAQGYLLARPAEPGELDELVLRGCPLPV